MVVRAAAADDHPSIAALYGHVVRTSTASYETDPPTPADMTQRLDALAAAGLPALVAHVDDHFAGTPVPARTARAPATAGQSRTRFM